MRDVASQVISILLVSLMLALAACKQRQADSGLMAAAGQVDVDRAVVESQYQTGKTLGNDLKKVDELIDEEVFNDSSRRFITDSLRREASYARSVFNMLKKFASGGAAIRAENRRSVDAGEVEAVKGLLIKIYEIVGPHEALGRSLETPEIIALRPAMSRLKELHDKTIATIGGWRSTGQPQQQGQDSQVQGGQGQSGAPVVVTPGDGQAPAPTARFDQTGCPLKPRSNSYAEREAYWLAMQVHYAKLVDAQRASSLGFPTASALQSTIKDFYQKPTPAIQPGDCGPGRPTDQCVGKRLLQELSRATELRCLFTASAGVSEGYTLGDHTLMVLQVYASQKSHYGTSNVNFDGRPLDNVLPVILALHDIGKPIAVASGDRRRQHEFSIPIVRGVMKAMGYSSAQINLASAMIDQDVLGEALISIDERRRSKQDAVRSALAALKGYARMAGMKESTYRRVQGLYYISDAASYPNLQTKVFQRCQPSGRLCSRTGALESIISDQQGDQGYGNNGQGIGANGLSDGDNAPVVDPPSPNVSTNDLVGFFSGKDANGVRRTIDLMAGGKAVYFGGSGVRQYIYWRVNEGEIELSMEDGSRIWYAVSSKSRICYIAESGEVTRSCLDRSQGGEGGGNGVSVDQGPAAIPLPAAANQGDEGGLSPDASDAGESPYVYYAPQ